MKAEFKKQLKGKQEVAWGRFLTDENRHNAPIYDKTLYSAKKVRGFYPSERLRIWSDGTARLDADDCIGLGVKDMYFIK